MRVTAKGQVTIPEAIRRESGMLPGTEVDFVNDGTRVALIKVERGTRARASSRERRLGEVLDRLRGSATIKMSTEEIMALTRGE